MASHFDCLGVDVNNKHEFDDLIQLAVRNSKPLHTPWGDYFP